MQTERFFLAWWRQPWEYERSIAAMAVMYLQPHDGLNWTWRTR